MAPRTRLGFLASAVLLAMTGLALGQAKHAGPAFDSAYLRDAKNIETGRRVWEEQCRHCHGASAYPGKAPKLNPGAMDPGFIFDRVTNGFGKMPGWKDVFSEEERKSVVAYIKSDQFSP